MQSVSVLDADQVHDNLGVLRLSGALNLGKDKTTGLIESVGPERIRADGKAVTTPLENPE